MKLNTDIYKDEIELSGNIGLKYNATSMLSTMLNDGRINNNIPIDDSIFFAVDFKPLDDYFVRTGNHQSHNDEWVEGTNNPAGVCVMVNSMYFNTNSDNEESLKAIYPIKQTVTPRIAYDSDGEGEMRGRFLTKFSPTDIVFLVRVIAYKFTYTESGDVSSYSNRIDVTVKEFEDNYKNEYHIVGIYVQPYIKNYNISISERRRVYGIGVTHFSTYNENTIGDNPDNFKIYGSLFYGDYPQEHSTLQNFIFGVDALNTTYFNGYDYIYANIGKISLWDKQYFANTNPIYQGYLPIFKYTLNNIHELYSHMGMFYTFDINLVGSPLNTDGIYCGKLSDDGKITGTHTNGSENTTIPQYTWTTPTDWQNNNFNGINNTDPNNYTDKIDLNKPTLSNVNVFNRSFAVNANTVKNLADFLWNADETKFQEIVKGLALMGENPMNGIIDLRLFPFNVALKNSATQAEPIVIGRTNTGVNGIKLTENVNSLIDLGECTFFTKFKNFLDYEPYTTAQLYIPYIGVVPVSTAEFMGHRISVKMIVDYTTGAGTAIVFKDDIPFIYRNGVVGVSIPMTGNDSTSYANTVIGNVVSGVVGGVTSIASGNIGGMVSSAEKLYSGFATGTNYQEASASSPSVATWQPQRCYFIIDRPILNVPDNYGRTIGFACEKTGKLSDFKGFTVVSNPEINFRCTDSERQYIVNMLQGGVFV